MSNTQRVRTGRQVLVRVLALLVGLVFIVFGVKERLAMSHIRSVGIGAVVEPIENYTTRKSKGFTTYSATFNFKTAAGQAVSRRRPFPEELAAIFVL